MSLSCFRASYKADIEWIWKARGCQHYAGDHGLIFVYIVLLFTAESRTCCAITGHNLWLEMGFAHRRRRFIMAKPVTITVQRAVNSNLKLA